MKKPPAKEFPILPFPTQNDFELWLSENHDQCEGIWLQFFKKSSGVQSIIYAEALDVALCYGWIDSQANKYDELSYVQKFTPRRKKSLWSKRNREHIERLSQEGRIQPPGWKEIEAAKADGRWAAAYDSPANIAIPDDFMELLAQQPEALAFFHTLNKTNTYYIAFQLQTAKKTETRERRMITILEKLTRREKFY
ncbi:MAG: YdeI/OmpD-associated family protein [Bacteroidia bacterium]|nr:YdeI/OmpD-associated family protein [Bacteroidia bacterium]